MGENKGDYDSYYYEVQEIDKQTNLTVTLIANQKPPKTYRQQNRLQQKKEKYQP